MRILVDNIIGRILKSFRNAENEGAMMLTSIYTFSINKKLFGLSIGILLLIFLLYALIEFFFYDQIWERNNHRYRILLYKALCEGRVVLDGHVHRVCISQFDGFHRGYLFRILNKPGDILSGAKVCYWTYPLHTIYMKDRNEKIVMNSFKGSFFEKRLQSQIDSLLLNILLSHGYEKPELGLEGLIPAA